MKQIEATPERPFYSVCYQYSSNPWTLWGYTHWDGDFGRTMPGTDSLELAKEHADKLVKSPGISLALVHETKDCYNHTEVYRAERVKA